MRQELGINKICLGIITFLLLTSCNNDIQDVVLEGYVYDKTTELPIKNALLKIENAYYEGGDFDSYNHYDKYEITTNEKGYFKIELDKSAYIQIDINEAGYQNYFQAIEVYSKSLSKMIYLSKI
ncbi:hypothetical protein [uncultured Dokdonia sp.]|uniref:hypothetical protein n=1 Tax=uncultured Dokdonia sp. TaxID=575653 RepID=UPI00260FCF4E|nr:hypothetical protein [uncultured Dokdonia sp.]